MALAKYRFSNAAGTAWGAGVSQVEAAKRGKGAPAYKNDRGFSLVEVLIATALLAMSLTALAQLFAISVKNNAVAKNGTFTQILAAQKMEQLRGLTWGFDTLGLPVSDVATDTTVSPEAATGG